MGARSSSFAPAPLSRRHLLLLSLLLLLLLFNGVESTTTATLRQPVCSAPQSGKFAGSLTGGANVIASASAAVVTTEGCESENKQQDFGEDAREWRGSAELDLQLQSERCTIDRHSGPISEAEFLRLYHEQRPVILKDLTDNAPFVDLTRRVNLLSQVRLFLLQSSQLD